MTPEQEPSFSSPNHWCTNAQGHKLAVCYRPATSAQGAQLPPLLFCPGYGSDMNASKASALDSYAAQTGRALLRFDYSGHGQSQGLFVEGTIGSWSNDALCVLDSFLSQPPLVIGSSMGGWIALHIALKRPIAGLVLIAPAPDFTQDLLEARLTAAHHEQLARTGQVALPSEVPGSDYIFTQKFLDDGRKQALLHAPINYQGRVRILHGQQDLSVDWRRSLTLLERLESSDAQLLLLKSGNHSLSDPEGLNALIKAVKALSEPVQNQDQ